MQSTSLAEKALPFVKMHGLGNDFVMVQDTDLMNLTAGSDHFYADPAGFLSALARRLCDRRFGLGADGLIVALRTRAHSATRCCNVPFFDALESAYPYIGEALPFSWIYINCDGSPSQMCGNGLRCLALFMYSLGWEVTASSGKSISDFHVATSVYPVTLTVMDLHASGGGGTVGTTFPAPEFKSERIPCVSPGDTFISQPICVDGLQLKASAVGMGNPHCVIFDSPELNLDEYANSMRGISGGDASRFPSCFPPKLLELGEKIQALPIFPQGVNVEFVLPESDRRALVFVVERGCGPTLACGSGALAVVAAGVEEGLLNSECCVILPGGELTVRWSKKDNCMQLIGPAQFVYSGRTLLELNFDSHRDSSADRSVKGSGCVSLDSSSSSSSSSCASKSEANV